MYVMYTTFSKLRSYKFISDFTAVERSGTSTNWDEETTVLMVCGARKKPHRIRIWIREITCVKKQ